MLKRLAPLLVVLVAATALASTPAVAPAKSRVCAGKVMGKYPVVVIRGVSCTTAKRTAAQFIRSRAPSPWLCGLAHAPFRKIAGVKIGASCGYGKQVGGVGVTGRTHAFAIGA
ncbi:hypothetical protein DSM112329_05059 [Paraconexibacter sp. AEG42_29]|uniref:Secreted protein n=1 Tax=Paraconexibacter sp. AEG42_29 TaxID=2997339 RepID=A0AAU7B3C1_9ACTN